MSFRCLVDSVFLLILMVSVFYGWVIVVDVYWCSVNLVYLFCCWKCCCVRMRFLCYSGFVICMVFCVVFLFVIWFKGVIYIWYFFECEIYFIKIMWFGLLMERCEVWINFIICWMIVFGIFGLLVYFRDVEKVGVWMMEMMWMIVW